MPLRWPAWVAFLLTEMGLLSARYHWAAVPEERIDYGRWLVEPAFPAALVTALAVASVRRRPEGNAPGGIALRGPYVIAHLAAFLGFSRTIAWIFSDNLASSPYPDAWLVGWLFGNTLTPPLLTWWAGVSSFLGFTALAFWVAAIFPPSVQRHWLGWRPLFLGTGFGLAAAASGWTTQFSWLDLNRATFWVVHYLLSLISSDVICRPEDAVLGLGDFRVWIAPACSGYEGIGLVLTYLGLYLWIDRRRLRFPRALLLLPIGAAIIWSLNAIRLAALVVIGAWVSPVTAMQGFHTQSGWLAFNLVALGLVALARKAHVLHRDPGSVEVYDRSSTAAYLVPLLAMVATGMITRAFSDGFDRLYPVRVIAAVAALIYFRGEYRRFRWTFSWVAIGLGFLVFGLWLAMGAFGPRVGVAGGSLPRWEELPPFWAWSWMIGRIAGSVVVVPIVEELAFRGYLVRRLISREFETVSPGLLTWRSLLVSSILFGVLHQPWPAGVAAGVIYALALHHRGRLTDAVVAHGTTNGLLAAHALMTGDWSFWS